MRNYTVFFPERVVEGESNPACSCMMVSCDSHHVPRGVKMTIQGNTRQEVWDRMKREYPFERIDVTYEVG